MRWPKHPVCEVRPSRFVPPFCPWPECPAHRTRGHGFQRFGSYRPPRQAIRIPRFRCRDCRRTCSRQTFSTTYYLKRPELLVAVAAGLAACSAHRQIARSARCAKTSVTRMAERLGRHAVLFHARCLMEPIHLEEAIVHDHFETFLGRQDRALGVGTAVGSDSWFVYDIDPAPHQGSGRRPDRREPTILRPKQAYVRSIRRTFHRLIPKIPGEGPLIARVDGRMDYAAAVHHLYLGSKVRLEVYPNPKRGPKGSPRSAEAILRDWAMFPNDQLHQLIRHTCSDHKRETIAFGRRLESIVGRLHLIAAWKNFIKARSERRPDRSTPAMRIGLTNEPWQWERVLSRRLFPGRVPISDFLRNLYEKRWSADLPTLNRAHAA